MKMNGTQENTKAEHGSNQLTLRKKQNSEQEAEEMLLNKDFAVAKNLTTEVAGDVKKRVYCSCPCGLRPFHLMNGITDGVEYEPTPWEEFANFFTHFIPAILSICATFYMFKEVNTHREMISASIYGGCLFLLFSISSSYHLTGFLWGKDNNLNRVFQKMDHTIIFTFIAASYTPWTILIDIGDHNVFGKAVATFIWAFAVFGTLKSCISSFLPNLSSMLLYLSMGWVSLIYMTVLIYKVNTGSMTTELKLFRSVAELAGGGLLYSGGTIIFQMDGRLPFAHAIWHLFVAAAAAVHLHAVYTYVMILE